MNTQKLNQDLERAQLLITDIEAHQKKNYKVAVQNYLEPWVFSGRTLPMNHSFGLVMYYRRILETLKFAIDEGFISKEKLPHSSPKYLEELVKYLNEE